MLGGIMGWGFTRANLSSANGVTRGIMRWVFHPGGSLRRVRQGFWPIYPSHGLVRVRKAGEPIYASPAHKENPKTHFYIDGLAT